MPKSLTYRELILKLKKYGIVEVGKGKGSERILGHSSGIDANGKYKGPQSTVTCHGERDTLGKGLVKAILRRFNIEPKDFWSEN